MKKSIFDQFQVELDLVKDLNAQSCPYKRNENEYFDESLLKRSDKFLPIVKDKLSEYIDFGSKELTNDRKYILNTDTHNFYSEFDSVMRTCYLKDTIFDGKKELFAKTTGDKKISSGGNGIVALYYDKETGLPVTSGKFAIDYGFKYNDLYFNTRGNFEIVHESLIGLELINKAKYFLPNYPSTFGLGYCDMDKENGETRSCGIYDKNIISMDAPVVFIEYLSDSFTLADFLRGKKFKEDVYNHIKPIYLQIFNALNILHMLNGCYTHYDLHPGNVLLKKLDDYILIPIYIFDKNENLKKINYIKTKYVVYIIDYGLNTFFSYESLAKEFFNKNTKYYGMDIEEITKKFIFGNEVFKDHFNFKIEDQAFDIHKIIGFSIYYVNISKNFDENIKRKLIKFLGSSLTYLYNMSPTLKNTTKMTEKFIRNIDRHLKNYFKKPTNIQFTKTYNDLVMVIGKAKGISLLTEEEIVSDNELQKILYSTCLGENCRFDSPIINQKLVEILNGGNLKFKNNIPTPFEEVRNIFIQRRENIEYMLSQLSNNLPSSSPKKPNTNDEKVELLGNLFDLDGQDVYMFSFKTKVLISGKELYEKILDNNQITNLVGTREIIVFMVSNRKKEVYRNDVIIDISKEKKIAIFIIEPRIELNLEVYNLDYEVIGELKVVFPFFYANTIKIEDYIKKNPRLIELLGEKPFGINISYTEGDEDRYEPKENVIIDLRAINHMIVFETKILAYKFNLKVYDNMYSMLGQFEIVFPFFFKKTKSIKNFIKRDPRFVSLLGENPFILNFTAEDADEDDKYEPEDDAVVDLRFIKDIEAIEAFE